MAAGLKPGDRVACITNMQRGIVRAKEGRRALIWWGTDHAHREMLTWVPVVDLVVDEESAHLPPVGRIVAWGVDR